MNEQRFTSIVQEHKDTIYRICLGYCYESDLVDDLYQEVLIQLWKSLDRFRKEAKISTYIYRITVNTAISYNRKIKGNRQVEADPKPEATTQEDAHHQIVQNEELTNLRTCIRKLPEQDRLVITLLLEEMSYQDIADVTGLSLSYVGVKIMRIKETLKHCIEDHE